MKKAQDLKTYLQNWKHHYLPDVEGQQAGDHLSDQDLDQVLDGVADEQRLDHLSSCPLCLERWSDRIGDSVALSAIPRPLAYGQPDMDEEEDDVMGQTAARELTSHCGRFRLRLLPDGPGMSVTLVVQDAALEGVHLQVRTKEGDVLLNGRVEQQQLGPKPLLSETHDFSLWSVLAVD